MSRSGLCRDCGPIVYAEAMLQLARHDGPVYLHWLEQLSDAVARLWGEALTPDTIADEFRLDTAEEAEAWLAGLRE